MADLRPEHVKPLIHALGEGERMAARERKENAKNLWRGCLCLQGGDVLTLAV